MATFRFKYKLMYQEPMIVDLTKVLGKQAGKIIRYDNTELEFEAESDEAAIEAVKPLLGEKGEALGQEVQRKPITLIKILQTW